MPGSSSRVWSTPSRCEPSCWTIAGWSFASQLLPGMIHSEAVWAPTLDHIEVELCLAAPPRRGPLRGHQERPTACQSVLRMLQSLQEVARSGPERPGVRQKRRGALHGSLGASQNPSGAARSVPGCPVRTSWTAADDVQSGHPRPRGGCHSSPAPANSADAQSLRRPARSAQELLTSGRSARRPPQSPPRASQSPRDRRGSGP